MSKTKIEILLEKGVEIPKPDQVIVGEDVSVEHIEPGVTLYPGVKLYGSQTRLGSGSQIGKEYGGLYSNICTGRNVSLGSGFYQDCVFLDGASVRSGAEIRGGTLFMEKANAAHTVGCKMTVAGIAVTLGSLINFCDILITGGSDQAFGFTEIGSGAIHYNFTQNGLKFASLVGPGALGEMYGLFPRTFVGGQTQVIGPTTIGSGCLIPAGTAVRAQVGNGLISVQPPLPEGSKKYDPDYITRAKSKFDLTADLIVHYRVLAEYFRLVRQKFAQMRKDSFLEELLGVARDTLCANSTERISWLFDKKEEGQQVDLFAKLPHSLGLHQDMLKSAHGKKIRFHLENIYGHELLLGKKKALKESLEKELDLKEYDSGFLAKLPKLIEQSGAKDYFSFIRELSPQDKKLGQQWLQNALTDVRKKTDQIIPLEEISPIVLKVEKNVELLRPCLNNFTELYQHRKFIISENFLASDLGVLNRDFDWYSDIAVLSEELFQHENQSLSSKELKALFVALKNIIYPTLVSWPILLSGAKEAAHDPDKMHSLISRAAYRFHGTDGLRGSVICPLNRPTLVQAIRRFNEQHELTPEVFEGLARNSIRALEIIKGGNVSSVAIARDTRDIYCDDPQLTNVFYYALKAGALSTGKTVYDLGVTTIANVPHVLAYFDSPSASEGIDLILYKSASHNPASQDGLKVFVKQQDDRGQSVYVKAMSEMENVISALLVQEAFEGIQEKKWGVYHNIEKLGQKIFTQALTDPRNLPLKKFLPETKVVCDLSHGAISTPEYQTILESCLERAGISETKWVGNQPDGKNINSNEGEDRVGAAHFENIQEITREEIVSGQSFFGFPVLEQFFAWGKAQSKEAQNKEGLVFGSLVDGDGDRGISLVYDSFTDRAQVFDGDKSLYLQIYHAVAEKSLNLGDLVVFTVESSVTFINAILDCIRQVYPVELLLSEEAPISLDKINLKITAVGDKYILKEQALGGETSGHIIRKYLSSCIDKRTEREIYVGNGFLANLHTISAISQIVQENTVDALKGKTPQERFAFLASPYPSPVNNIVYVYFVQKDLWYENSLLWEEVEKVLVDSCQKYSLKRISFSQELDTMYYYSLRDDGTILFSILARPSGTENKMGVKLYGCEEVKELFEQISEAVFQKIALIMKNKKLRSLQDEQKILDFLAQTSSGNAPLSELRSLIKRSESAHEKAHFMHIIEAISGKCQKLADYDGKNLTLTIRGKEYLRLQKS